ncbi:MAG: hypothetical protein CNCCGFBP_02391 [Fimbriimonadaceae bacterium]|nr:hypothetical protein [Fimbriimonadaceae bacterium]
MQRQPPARFLKAISRLTKPGATIGDALPKSDRAIPFDSMSLQLRNTQERRCVFGGNPTPASSRTIARTTSAYGWRECLLASKSNRSKLT